MTICIDTNVLVQLFGRREIGRSLRSALLNGEVSLALSNEILLEYEETICRVSGRSRWSEIEKFLGMVYQLNGNVLFINPQFRFQVVIEDPDDNKFVDCAIAAEADHIVTADRHFDALIASGYKPQPITIEKFVQRYL